MAIRIIRQPCALLDIDKWLKVRNNPAAFAVCLGTLNS
jgi:hypothetical protein